MVGKFDSYCRRGDTWQDRYCYYYYRHFHCTIVGALSKYTSIFIMANLTVIVGGWTCRDRYRRISPDYWAFYLLYQRAICQSYLLIPKIYLLYQRPNCQSYLLYQRATNSTKSYLFLVLPKGTCSTKELFAKKTIPLLLLSLPKNYLLYRDLPRSKYLQPCSICQILIDSIFSKIFLSIFIFIRIAFLISIF